MENFRATMSSTDQVNSGFQLEILFSDEYLYCVNKPAGLPVSSSRENVESVLSLLYDEFGESGLRVPHRLDQPTQGVQLITRGVEADRRFAELFRNRKVVKEYWAAVTGKVAGKGNLQHRLIHEKQSNKSRVTRSESAGKSAELSYDCVLETDNYSLLRVFPVTGRHHQIRVQMQAMGNPIKGDVKYGARRGNKDRSIHLLARSLAFEHPFTGEKMSFAVNPIKDAIWDLWPQGSSER
jgi:23S rRNA pseudouridine1911/1915/1917 synthase